MKSVLSILRSGWFWTLVGAVILALLVWFFGDLIQIGAVRPLGGPLARGLTALVILLLAAGWIGFKQYRAKRANARLVKELAATADEPAPGAGDVAELQRRFSGALDQLRRSRLGGKGNRRWLYELPWYVMIGPPGSGKTTALAQSGLRFPLGQASDMRGVGGTRYCDWIFSDEAVLIDTAGRYTSQDSQKDADSAAWLGFLDLLKKYRPRQPLNGVLVTISVKELLEGRSAGVDHAARIRARLEEIETRLNARLPIYLMVTKADLLAGFTTYFDDLRESEREQVWGFTFDHQPGEADKLDEDALQAGLHDLVVRLDRRLPRRLAEENDLERRAAIFGFPARVEELGQELLRFVERCFPPTSFERGAWLRGVYLTSGTQTGTPIDRLMAAISASVGVPATPLPASSGDRSFFLTRLLKEVVFGEASLVGRNLARERRDSLLRTAGIAALGIGAILLIGAWTWSYLGNRERSLGTEQALAAWAEEAQPYAREQLSQADDDYVALFPILDDLGGIRRGLQQPDPLPLRFGLSQRTTTEARVNAAYRRALADLLLPRLVLAVEGDLRDHLQDPEYVIQALKVYLMLGGGAPADAGLIEAWFALDTRNRAPELADSARRHVGAMAAMLPTIERRPTLDSDLLADAQAALQKVPLARRAYDALVSSEEVRQLPGWRVTDHAGPNAALTLVRRSGQPLNAEVPAIFTYDGFHQVFLPLLDDAARSAYAENWVLAGQGRSDPTTEEIERLKSDMLKLYYDDAIAAWDGLLRDVTLTQMSTLDQAVEATKALSGPNSPLKLLIESIVHETSLTVPPETAGQDAGQQAADAAAQVASKLNSRFAKLGKLLARDAQAAAEAQTPGAPVEQHFAYLKDVVEGVQGAPPALDEAIAALGSLNAKLSEAALSPNPGQAFAKIGPTGAASLGAAAERLPEPLNQMLGGVAARAESISKGGIRERLNTVWRGDVLPFCRKAIGGRFPFDRRSRVDASLDDVIRLFGPGGLIPGFIQKELGPFVDTSRRPWRDEQSIGLSSGALGLLERADKISAALFAAGGSPKASFSLTPLDLDSGAASVVLDLDGQEVRYAHGPARPTSLTWPGPGGSNITRLTFAPVGGGPPATLTMEGPWSLFRLLHEATFAPTDQPDLFDITLSWQGHSARFRLRAGSVENPFDLRLLSGFACPEAL